MTIEELLQNVNTIIQKNDELIKLRQENFNIFQIIRKGHEETSLHSAFLTELLNCNGSHDFGNTFLKLFIDELKLTQYIDYESEITVQSEKAIDSGRVDIYIKDETHKTVVIIENKIYAQDQNAQLIRYYEEIKKLPNGKLLYLTLDGREPSAESKGVGEECQYECISYRNDIICWLNKCLKEATEHPTLRETIKQYIFLLKRLTGQMTDKIAEKEIIDIITSNYAECKRIAANLWNAELSCTECFIHELSEKINENFKEVDGWIYECEDLTKKWTGFSIRHKNWNEHISVKLEGDEKVPWHRVILGIRAHIDKVDRQSLQTLFAQELRRERDYCGSGAWWPFYLILLGNKGEAPIEHFISQERREELVKSTCEKMTELIQVVKAKLDENDLAQSQ